MKRTTAACIVLIMITSGFLLMNPISEDAEGNLLNDAILATRSPISIDGRSDNNFTSANGVSSGSGTPSDPFIIENFKIDATQGHGIDIRSSDYHFIIRNCWIFDGRDSMSIRNNHGVYLDEVQNGVVQNCLFERNSGGVHGERCSNILIDNNTCNYNGDGIAFQYECSNIIVTNNTCRYNGCGVKMGGDHSTVANNSCIRNTGYGIYVGMGNGHNLVEYNDCLDTYSAESENHMIGTGIKIGSSHNNIVRYNNCSGGSGRGIYVHESDDNLIEGNVIYDIRATGDGYSRYGLSISISNSNTFRNNLMWDCGIYFDSNNNVEDSSTYNSIDGTNKVNGKSVIYRTDSTHEEYFTGDLGPIILINCGSKHIQDMSIEDIPMMINIHNGWAISVTNTEFRNVASAIKIRRSDSIGVYDNSFVNFRTAIEARQCTWIGAGNNTFNNGMYGIYWDTDDSYVEYNDLIDVTVAVGIDGSRNCINKNTISIARYGIDVYGWDNRIINNIVESSRDVAVTFDESRNKVMRNQIIGNDVGIEIGVRTAAVVEENVIMNNRIGIHSHKALDGDIVRRNNISMNTEYGIDLSSPEMQRISVYQNVFFMNNQGGVQARDVSQTAYWDDQTSTGNYWSDYTARYPSATNDGTVWNIPYQVDGGTTSKDNYPLVSPPVTLPTILRISKNHQTEAPVDQDYSVTYWTPYTGDQANNITWTFSTNASWLSFDSSHTLKGKPTSSHLGPYWVNISVTDGILSDFTNFTIKVIIKNYPPEITTANVNQTNQWALYRVDYNATDDGFDLEWRLVTEAEFLSIDSKTGVLSGTPGQNDVGTFHVNVSVNDGKLWDVTHFDLTVIATNSPPMQNLSKPFFTMMEDTTLTYPVKDLFFDHENDPLTIALVGTTGVNASVDASGILSIDPDENWFGTGWLDFHVSDGYYNISFSVQVVVQNVNDPPTELNISFTSSTLVADGDQTVTANFTDPDTGDSANVTWYIDGVAVGYGSSYNLSLSAGSYNLTLRITDSTGNYTQITVPITVEGGIEQPPATPGPDHTWIIILTVSFLTLILVGALLFIIRRRTHTKEEVDESISIPSSPVSRRRPGAQDLEIGPSPEFKTSRVKGGHLGDDAMQEETSDEIPWFEGSDDDLDKLMEEALDGELVHGSVHETSSLMRRLKNRRDNGELSKEEFKELRSMLDRIREE